MTEPLDMSKDPDRFDAAVEASPPALDPKHDPDRFENGSRTLPELLGEGAHEDPFSAWTSLIGLAAVFGFLGFIVLLAHLS